jgi:hypothetical protein
LTVAYSAKRVNLNANENLVASARVRRITGLTRFSQQPKSMFASAIDRVRRVRQSRIMVLTGRRILVLRRALWTARPKTILAEIPLSEVQGASIAPDRPGSVSIYRGGRSEGGATIDLRDGGTVTVQVHSDISEGRYRFFWRELVVFVNDLRHQLGSIDQTCQPD